VHRVQDWLVANPQRKPILSQLARIAASCGFDDARQLRRLWKQSFGVSIAAFRAAHSMERSTP